MLLRDAIHSRCCYKNNNCNRDVDNKSNCKNLNEKKRNINNIMKIKKYAKKFVIIIGL